MMNYTYKKAHKFSSFLLLKGNILFVLFISGCITTNYYTGQTLEQGNTVLTPGVDNLVLIEQEEGVVDKDLSFSISVGVSHGLPWRFEAGIRSYFPYIWEANLRHQINPRSFTLFDISANFHSGIVISTRFDDVSPPYYKYGLTLSKKIFTFQPFVSYYINNKFKFDKVEESTDFRIISFGIAIPNHKDLIIPECSYYRSPSGENFYSIGIGLRASLNRGNSTEQIK
jgi:hypothetical protein